MKNIQHMKDLARIHGYEYKPKTLAQLAEENIVYENDHKQEFAQDYQLVRKEIANMFTTRG